MKTVRVFLSAVMAGIAIGIGGTVYLAQDNKVIGALLFGAGLVIICTQSLWLYTGKIGYVVAEKANPKYLINLLVTFLGNFVGTAITAIACCQVCMPELAEKANTMIQGKLSRPLPHILILGILCGILMYAAVDGYKKTKSLLIILLGVTVFILSGAEHCIADMYYFAAAGEWSLRALLVILTVALGNSVGGIMIPLLKEKEAGP